MPSKRQQLLTWVLSLCKLSCWVPTNTLANHYLLHCMFTQSICMSWYRVTEKGVAWYGEGRRSWVYAQQNSTEMSAREWIIASASYYTDYECEYKPNKSIITKWKSWTGISNHKHDKICVCGLWTQYYDNESERESIVMTTLGIVDCPLTFCWHQLVR